MSQCQGMCKRMTMGYAWFHMENGNWKRYIIHQCPDCKTKDPERIHPIDAEKPFCIGCLNQELDVAEDSDGVKWYTCPLCNDTFGGEDAK